MVKRISSIEGAAFPLQVFPPACQTPDQNVQYTPSSGFGGVIISDSTQQFAMGVYGRTPAASCPVGYFTLWDFINCGGTSKWSAVFGPNITLPAGESTYKTWIASGTLADVTAKMRQLFLDGAS